MMIVLYWKLAALQNVLVALQHAHLMREIEWIHRHAGESRTIVPVLACTISSTGIVAFLLVDYAKIPARGHKRAYKN